MTVPILAAVIRGDEARWPVADAAAARGFLEEALRHGVLPLVARQFRRGALSDAPDLVQQTLARAALQQAAVEQRLAADVRRLLAALADARIPCLLMKGVALAYTLYPHPCLRPRTDTDLLVRSGDVAAASQVFDRLGYSPLNVTRGALVLYQRSYARGDGLGIRHVYDLHWKVAAPQMVADLLGWDELEADARPVPALGDHARAIGDAHALLLACVHRLAHHYDDPSLIWLYDIHLLASRLDEAQLHEFMRLAAGKAAALMCVRSLTLARDRFRTPLPAGLASLVESGSSRTLLRSNDSAGLFDRRTRMVDVLLSDLSALSGWRQRVRLLREHLLPPADYIRRLYGVSNPLALPALYAHRCVSGAWKWLQPLADHPPSD